MKKIAVLIIVNVVLLIALAAAVELILRFAARGLPPDGRQSDGSLYTWGHTVAENRYGFRDREFPVPKPAGTFRIIVVGDSFVWGAGLAEEERFSNRLEKYLRRDCPENGIEVLNFGISGGATVHEYGKLRAYIDPGDPDLIIIGFCLNDTQPRGETYSVEKERYKPLFNAIARMRRVGLTHLSDLLLRRVPIILERMRLIPNWKMALQRTYEPGSREWKDFTAALRDIKSLSDARGLPPPVFAVLNQGTCSDRPTDYSNPDDVLRLYLKWYHQAEDAARQAGFVTVNFEDEFKRRLSREILAVNPWDGHPSALCNEVYALKLRDIVLPLIREGRASPRTARKVSNAMR